MPSTEKGPTKKNLVLFTHLVRQHFIDGLRMPSTVRHAGDTKMDDKDSLNQLQP